MPVDHKEFDIIALERALENAENADAEVHKLYNNLGLAYTAAGRHREALRVHREEKKACKRLVAAADKPSSCYLDLSIAYRRCGDATLQVDTLLVTEGALPGRGRGITITSRDEIARKAHAQHKKALSMAVKARDAKVPGSALEVQAAYAAMAHSALKISFETKSSKDYATVVTLCTQSAMLAENMTDSEVNGRQSRAELTLSAAVNLAVAISGLGDKTRAKTLFQVAGVRAKELGDTPNLIRCVANLAEEAGDDSDWLLCLEYVDKWVALAKKENDLGEEADALRKRGAALYELRRLEEAREALDRAVLIGSDDQARSEARRNLAMVETEIKELREAEDSLKQIEPKCIHALDCGDKIEEAKMRLAASEAAVKLRRDGDILEHLGRYFVLVDDYGCTPSSTGVDKLRHCDAITAMAEVHWRAKRPSVAVEWGMRELAAYKDDIAGQAQAWCNIGIYLDDDGKYENAKEALLRSVSLAQKADDQPLRRQAEANLKIVIANQADNEKVIDEVHGGHDRATLRTNDVPLTRDDPVSLCPDDNRKALSRSKKRSYLAENCGSDDAQSIDICSGNLIRPEETLPVRVPSIEVSRDGSVSRNVPLASKSGSLLRSGARLSGARSSGEIQRYRDLASIYRKECAAIAARGGELIEVRDIVLERLASLSAKLVVSDECDVVKLDLGALFLGDDEFPPLIRTLSYLPEQGPLLSIDMRFNPLLGGKSFRWLAASPGGPPRSLPSFFTLDLSGTGLDSYSFGILARAMGKDGVLNQVRHLYVGKNGLGRSVGSAADAVACLLVQSNVLRTIDLSLNLLSNNFMILLTDNIERLITKQSTRGTGNSTVEHLDLRLNNRKYPTALLEWSTDCLELLISRLRRLTEAIPSLRRIDLRACGASSLVRRRLYHLREELRQPQNISRENFSLEPTALIITSEAVFDEEEPTASIQEEAM